MGFSFRPAQRSNAKPLIGLYSESGAGKTLSALYLARGFVGPSGKIGMIETESGRGEAYADIIPGGYQAVSISGDFAPKQHGLAIEQAEKEKFDALIIDSASHEWESAGGVLDMAATNQANGKKGVLVWQQPKMEHQRQFILKLMATPIPLVILCMRAKYPMEEVKVSGGGKEWRRAERLEPKQSEDILFEMFIHGWIGSDHKFHCTKYPERLPELKDVLKEGEPITMQTGERLAAWAKGLGPRTVDDDPTAVDRLTFAINECVSLDALKAVADQVKALPKPKQELLRAAYTVKMTALKTPVRESGEEG